MGEKPNWIECEEIAKEARGKCKKVGTGEGPPPRRIGRVRHAIECLLSQRVRKANGISPSVDFGPEAGPGWDCAASALKVEVKVTRNISSDSAEFDEPGGDCSERRMARIKG